MLLPSPSMLHTLIPVVQDSLGCGHRSSHFAVANTGATRQGGLTAQGTELVSGAVQSEIPVAVLAFVPLSAVPLTPSCVGMSVATRVFPDLCFVCVFQRIAVTAEVAR